MSTDLPEEDHFFRDSNYLIEKGHLAPRWLIKMNVKLRTLVILIVIGIVLALGCSNNDVQSQPPCGFVQNTLGQRVSLKNSVITMYFDANFPPQYYQDVQTAVTTWENIIGRHAIDLQMTPLPASTPSQDGKSVIYWISNWDPTLKTQQANTTIYWDGDVITEADVKFDATYFIDSDTPSPTTVDMPSLALHEIGHVFGLKHDDADQSVMATFLINDFERRNLYTADVQHIQCEY